MSARREAIVLPMLFLTVVLAAAVRPGSNDPVTPPSLASLIAATAMLALLVRSGAVAPERLVHPARPMLANVNGTTVLLTMFAASAQVITALVPESGVPALIGWAVLISLVAQAFAMGPDRTRLLRGLLVTFAAAFALKFVLLAALSTPAQGRLGRALQVLFEGLTLGAVSQRLPHPAEGYLTFGAISLYLVGVSLLPSAAWKMVAINTRELSRARLPDSEG